MSPLSTILLKGLIISRVRVKVLTLFLLNPAEMFYVREIVRKTGEEINAIRRELMHLEDIGLLKKDRRGNRLYYFVRKEYPLFFDLLELVNKTAGLGGAILKNKAKLGKLKYVMLAGQFARHLPRKKNDVDLLLIGDVVVAELTRLIKGVEKKYNRDVNYTVMSVDEFTFRKKRNDPFVTNILKGSRVMILGDEEELVV